MVVAVLSLDPVANLLSPRQAMNRSFDRLHLVNTYGAFGSVGRKRDEVILEGTDDPHPGVDTSGASTSSRASRATPTAGPASSRRTTTGSTGSSGSRRCRRSAASRGSCGSIVKLLRGDADVKPLLAVDPFPDAPPRFIRATLWRYEFTHPGDGGSAWWRRTFVREYLRPIALDEAALAPLKW